MFADHTPTQIELVVAFGIGLICAYRAYRLGLWLIGLLMRFV